MMMAVMPMKLSFSREASDEAGEGSALCGLGEVITIIIIVIIAITITITIVNIIVIINLFSDPPRHGTAEQSTAISPGEREGLYKNEMRCFFNLQI